MFYVTKTKDCRGKKKKTFVLPSSLRIPDPYLLFQTPLSSSGTPDFLSTCPGNDFLRLSEYLELIGIFTGERNRDGTFDLHDLCWVITCGLEVQTMLPDTKILLTSHFQFSCWNFSSLLCCPLLKCLLSISFSYS